jgi:MerR family transcriptional regulator, light-induced transcriptional regulator
MMQDVSMGQAREYLPANDPLRDLLSRRSDGHCEAVQALAREVITRLERSKVKSGFEDAPVDPADIVQLCNALLSTEDAAAETLVMRSAAQGMSADTLHLAYIAEAARMMGERWLTDEATAADVIIGAGRIYIIMRKLRAIFVSAQAQRSERFRAVFAAAPGETHTIGLTMAADHLRRRGWQIDVKAGLGHEDLVDQIGHDPYPVIGLSASASSMIFPLARLIVALRVTNPGAWITIGGHIVEEEPNIVALIDADARVTTMDEAVAQMEMVMAGIAGASHHIGGRD